MAKKLSPKTVNFNPHTHKGCDYPPIDVIANSVDFNPHTHKGCDGG